MSILEKNNYKKIGTTIVVFSIITILLIQQPASVMDYTFDPPSGTLLVDRASIDWGETVDFQINLDRNSGPITKIIWVFHDGSDPVYSSDNPSSNEFSMSHQFTIGGQFLVSVLLIGQGSTHVVLTENIIVKNEPGTAKINDISGQYSEDELIAFNALQSIDLDDNISELTFQWQFGDGFQSSDPQLIHSFSHAATYPVTLFVFDDQYAVSVETKFIEIINEKPTASFTTNSQNQFTTPNNELLIFLDEDESISFNASSSVDTTSDLNTLQYYWQFGDNSIEKGREVSHTYLDQGEYELNLTVIDNDGISDTITAKVNVSNHIPNIDLLINNSADHGSIQIQEGESIPLNLRVSDSPSDIPTIQYTWNFDHELSGSHVIYSAYDNNYGVIQGTAIDDNNALSTTSSGITVTNVDPLAWLISASVKPNLTLRVSGEKWHDVQFLFYKNAEMDMNHTLVREPGDPNTQSLTIPIDFSIQYEWTVNVVYTPENDPLNGQPQGANPTWLDFIFETEGYNYSLQHTFNYNDPENWIWNIDLNAEFQFMPVTYDIQFYDPGADELDIDIYFNNTLVRTTHIYPNTPWGVSGVYTTKLITNSTGNVTLNIYDDDGGFSTRNYNLDFDNKYLIEGFDPHLELLAPKEEKLLTNIEFNLLMSNLNFNSSEWNITWLIEGYENITGNMFQNHTFVNPGDYLVQVKLENYNSNSFFKIGIPISIINSNPKITLASKLTGYEGEFIDFNPVISDIETNTTDLLIFWSFGDSQIGIGHDINHKYEVSGIYTLQLLVVDPFGGNSIKTVEIEILDQNPQIFLDPVISYEGQVFTVHPQIIDSPSDELSQSYSWNLESDTFDQKTLSKYLNDGSYYATFEVYDNDGGMTSENLELNIRNIPVQIIQPQKLIFYGDDTSKELNVFFVDSFLDMGNIVVIWQLQGEDMVIDTPSGISSSFDFDLTASKTFDILVKATDDPSSVSIKTFYVSVTLDNDGDGIINEMEELTDPDNADSDGDYLSDEFEREIGTDPNSPDSDNDGIYDGYGTELGTGELALGTNPNNADSDGDQRYDGSELIPYPISYTDAQNPDTITEEYVTSDPTLWDSDGDDLSDFDEFELKLNPMSDDTDSDGISDGDEIAIYGTNPSHFDTDLDGLPDGEEVMIIENYSYFYDLGHNRQYIDFTSDPLKSDTDGDGINDFDEKALGLRADSDDTDNDGLKDGGEAYQAHFDLGKRETITLGASSGYSPVPSTETRLLRLNNVGIPTKFVLSLTLSEIQSYDGYGDLSFKIKYQGYEHISGTFSSDDEVFTNQFDLTEAINPYSYSSNWELEFRGFGKFLLEDASIEITTSINPRDADDDNDGLSDGEEIALAESWGTHPNQRDTDKDGIYDSQEISDGTNPLLKDTDGDGVNDNLDLSPTKNRMIRITINSATWKTSCPEGTPELSVIISFNGLSSYMTEWERASHDEIGSGLCKRKTKADIGDHYYFDVSDEVSLAYYTISIYRDGLFNDDGRSYSSTYTIGPTYSEPWNHDNGNHIINYTIETVEIEKSNVIAVHDSTGLEGGHYKNLNENYYIIYADITSQQSGYERVFYGNQVYTIIIPQSIFINTQLHRLLEQKDTDNMPSGLKYATFIGLEDSEYISDHVEAIINLGEISGNSAYNVLSTVLRNVTSNSDYSYSFSTFGPTVTRIGLPTDVLQLLPWKGVINSKNEDDVPSNLFDDLKDRFGTIIGVIADGAKLVVGGLIALGNFIVDVFEAVVDWGMGVKGVINAAVELVKKAILYAIVILGYLMKVFMNIVLTTMFASFVLIEQLAIGDYVTASIGWNDYHFSINYSGLVMDASIRIVNQYVPIFDLDLPSIQFDLGMVINEIESHIIASSGLIAIWQNDFNISTVPSSGNLSLMSQKSNTNTQSNNIIDRAIEHFNPTIFGFGATIADVLHLALAGVVSYGITTQNDFVSIGSFIGLMYGHIGILGLSHTRYGNEFTTGEVMFNSSLGQACSLLILSVMLFSTYPEFLSALDLSSKAAGAISTIGILISTWGFFTENDALSLFLTVSAEVLSSIGVLKIATSNKGNYKGYSDWYGFAIQLLIVGISMVGMAFIGLLLGGS